jgi:hypothetical protein
LIVYRTCTVADVDEVTSGDVAAGIPIRDCPPERQALWWRRQRPAHRERLINECPEHVGAMPGVPVRDRDAANRILLRRARECALAGRDPAVGGRRSALAGRSGHVGGQRGRAILVNDVRLASIFDLERRVATPGVMLVGYRPGDERNAVVQAAVEPGGSAGFSRVQPVK